jgi:hypothetical protein
MRDNVASLVGCIVGMLVMKETALLVHSCLNNRWPTDAAAITAGLAAGTAAV